MMRVLSHMPTRRKGGARSSINFGGAGGTENGSATRDFLRQRQMTMEKCAIFVLLMIAWGWIMVTFGMVFYHGYYAHQPMSAAFHQHFSHHRFPGEVDIEAAALQRLRQGHAFDVEPQSGNTVDDHEALTETSDKHKTDDGGVLLPHESPLLIITCSRENYLNETLQDIFKYIPRDCSMGCPIIISQDGNKQDVVNVIRDYQDRFQRELGIPLIHIQHKSALRGGGGAALNPTAAYKALAVHYGWALQHVFDGQEKNAAAASSPIIPKRVIILEEDLHIASDFFHYFKAMAPILDRDTSLLAVSAYNDNGFKSSVKDATRVLRSDFFPGLGWMMTHRLWVNELQSKWPDGFWDDWIREPEQRRDRQILRPEISRSFHFGVKGGTSHNQYGDELAKVLLNPIAVDWQSQDLSELIPDRFDRKYWHMLQSARHVETTEKAKSALLEGDVRLEYTSLQMFAHLAKQLGLMTDEKAGVPRTAYKGVVETRLNKVDNGEHFLLLTPPMAELQKSFEDVI